MTQTLSKGLRVLSLFDERHREWTLDQIVEASGLPRATAHRMAQALEHARYLVVDRETKKYHLGPAMLIGMYLSAGFSDLVRVARPYLEALAEETQESVILAVDIDGVAVGVDRIDTSRPYTQPLALGTIIGDLANSSGKIFCAFKSPEERERILASPHPQLTKLTVTDSEKLRVELEQVRREGVAFDMEERFPGICGVSAGVRNQTGELVASISVVAPTGRFGPEEGTRYAEAVRTACASLSAFLGYSDRNERSSEGEA
jgi:DNA-binding IclR family transcriptional regulator